MMTNYPCRDLLDFVKRIKEDAAVAKEAGQAYSKMLGAMVMQSAIITASRNRAELSKTCDGNPDTRWTTQRPMRNGDWISLELDKRYNVKIKKIVLENTTSGGDYPRGYEVYGSTDGQNWGDAIKSGQGTGVITEIILDEPVTANCLKVVQTGLDKVSWWSIDEIRLEVE